MPRVRLTGATTATLMRERFGFDPTHGFDLSALLQVGPPGDEPADLDSFWAGVASEAAGVDPVPQVGAWRELEPGIEAADLSYHSVDGVRIGGWVTRPAASGGASGKDVGDAVSRVVVVGHGYGGRDAPTLADVPHDAGAVFPVARGLPTRSEVPGVGGATGVHHVLWGIHSPRTYSHVGSVADVWLAARVARMVFPGARQVSYVGASFGGGIGALALGFGDCFDAGVLEVPSFGHHPWRVAVPSTGSASRVRERVREHPAVLRTLWYADAATAALRVRVPVLVLPALADPSVPVPGQFAVANALAGPTWVHVLPHGHCSGGDGCEDAGRAEAIAEFLADVWAARGCQLPPFARPDRYRDRPPDSEPPRLRGLDHQRVDETGEAFV